MRLKEIDERLKNDEIEPMEYIRLRREHVNSLISGNPLPSIETSEKQVAAPRAVRVAVITKSLFRKQIHTYPVDWELPREVSMKVIDMIFDMVEDKPVRDIKLRSGGYKIAGIASMKKQLALLILDADEEFDSYEAEIDKVNLVLKTEKAWKDALMKLNV